MERKVKKRTDLVWTCKGIAKTIVSDKGGCRSDDEGINDASGKERSDNGCTTFDHERANVTIAE